MGSTAAAQPVPALTRERQERQVVVSGAPQEPVPEVHVAAHVATSLVFNAPIDRASVEVEGRASRFQLVDVGERTLFLEPLVPPGDGERLGVRVRYKDGVSPAYASFALVSLPDVVDTRVDVLRGPRSPEVLEAALARCEADGLIGLVLSGRLGPKGVSARRINRSSDLQAGMQLKESTGFREESWAMVSIGLSNLLGQPAWIAGEARVVRADGSWVKMSSFRMDKPQLSAGEEGQVVAEWEAPTWRAGEVVRVELREKGGGRHLVVGTVRL